MITKDDIMWIKENKSNDVGFLFYSGDVLQDIAMLTNPAKGVYLQIVCLHMKKICFSHDEIQMFCSGLSEPEKSAIFSVLRKDGECYFIEWVLQAIKKRREYSISRSKNKKGNERKLKITKPKQKKISSTYDEHMENEIEDENKKENGVENIEKSELLLEFEKTYQIFKEMRIKIKKPMTEHAEDLLKKKLKKLSENNMQKAIDILNNSILNSWQDIYELKTVAKKVESANTGGRTTSRKL